ncbi:hypothetical protein ACTOVL_04930 [Arcanobacterium canis]
MKPPFDQAVAAKQSSIGQREIDYFDGVKEEIIRKLNWYLNDVYQGAAINETRVYDRALTCTLNYREYESIDFEEIWSAAGCPP